MGQDLYREIESADLMIRALRHIVHENASVKEAQEIFDSAKAGNGRVASVPA